MNKRKIYIWLFGILYGIVALVSTIHAISFFSLANMIVLGIMLAVGFEVGQAAVLFSLLTSPRERNKFMPWVLMCVLTLVQIIGNVYSSYKYLILNSEDNLRFFKEPIFIWTDLPNDVCNVILTYVIGGILPLVSLFMTSMITNYLTDDDKDLDKPLELDDDINIKKEYKEIEQENKIEESDSEDEDSNFINI